jgi:hypothetical protein
MQQTTVGIGERITKMSIGLIASLKSKRPLSLP